MADMMNAAMVTAGNRTADASSCAAFSTRNMSLLLDAAFAASIFSLLLAVLSLAGITLISLLGLISLLALIGLLILPRTFCLLRVQLR